MCYTKRSGIDLICCMDKFKYVTLKLVIRIGKESSNQSFRHVQPGISTVPNKRVDGNPPVPDTSHDDPGVWVKQEFPYVPNNHIYEVLEVSESGVNAQWIDPNNLPRHDIVISDINLVRDLIAHHNCIDF
jgi:hypothetical protein